MKILTLLVCAVPLLVLLGILLFKWLDNRWELQTAKEYLHAMRNGEGNSVIWGLMEYHLRQSGKDLSDIGIDENKLKDLKVQALKIRMKGFREWLCSINVIVAKDIFDDIKRDAGNAEILLSEIGADEEMIGLPERISRRNSEECDARGYLADIRSGEVMDKRFYALRIIVAAKEGEFTLEEIGTDFSEITNYLSPDEALQMVPVVSNLTSLKEEVEKKWGLILR